MKKYKIRIEPLAPLLCSNGDTSSTFDAQFVFDENGFPYFPAKTFKGLLRESMQEVLEIQQYSEKEIEGKIALYFGKGGTSNNTGILQLDNFYLPDYSSDYQAITSQVNGNKGISRLAIQRYFSYAIQQTALDENDIAADGSLRTFSVLDYTKIPAFETCILLEDEVDISILKKSLLQLRYAGIGRNRGFGKIKCILELVGEVEPEVKNLENDDFDCLRIEITTKEPIILGTQTADQNTVNSMDFIAGSQVLGMFAWNHNEKGSKDFNELFLKNKLVFEHCYPENAEPFPKAIHKEKYLPENEPVYHNVLNKTNECVTKEIGGFVDCKIQKVSVNKSFNFHAARPDRTAGRSTENDTVGGIFYYEAINKNQKFVGRISGDKAYLKKLVAIKGLKFDASIGKSKSSQYGKVGIVLSADTKKNNIRKFEKTIYMVVQTPVILLNEFGFPSPTLKSLKEALKGDFEIKCASARIVPVEHFNAIWRAKSGKFNAYDAGSTFRLELNTPQELETEQFVGIMNDKGYGKIKLLKEDELDKYKEYSKAEEPISSGESVLLNRIKEVLKEENDKIKKQEEAYEYSLNSRYEKITNSLISRMISVLNTATYIEDVQKFLKHVGEKSAGSQLKDAFLMEDLEVLGDHRDFKTYQTYWTAFFQALRKAKKK